MDWSWKEQLKLAGWEALSQLTGWRYAYKKARGLTDLKIHIETERAKQLRPYKGEKTFNVFILKRDKWICYLCLKPIPYGHAQVEHDLPVIRWGKTDESNCHASDDVCNQAKGTLTAAEYRAKVISPQA